MIVHRGYENLDLADPVVTLGVFDGVHRGHRALLDMLVKRAKDKGGEPAVITFYPHPRHFLGINEPELSLLTTMEEKQELLKSAGIRHLIILDFNEEFSNTGACDFVKDVLIGKVKTKHLIIGYDHRFGRSAEGDFNTIKQCRDLSSFTVEQAEGVFKGIEAISSSAIREALVNGKLDEANNMLGYNYSLSGIVVYGRKIGRAFGFPTANIEPEKYKLVPANGVYAVEVLVNSLKYRGMLSIGFNPTVNPARIDRSIEVHIIDFDEDIYGRNISVKFRYRLRDEKKFEDTARLAAQMELDKVETIRLLT
jgi:riboflavin kinase/FMN adenylyltransferase